MKKDYEAGVDEAGRGPLAGPVVAAAVILHPDRPIVGLTDSKLLTPKKRQALAAIIKEKAFAWAIAESSVEEIDKINILRASLLAMQRAIMQLNVSLAKVWVDGRDVPSVPYPVAAVIKGDRLIPSISAASILAKVTRDQQMQVYDAIYPQYEFGRHKGYGTARHLSLLKLHGPSALHRKSFFPVKEMIALN